jgi:hypothetical protein
MSTLAASNMNISEVDIFMFDNILMTMYCQPEDAPGMHCYFRDAMSLLMSS